MIVGFLFSCCRTLVLTIILVLAALVGFIALYPYQTLDQISKDWPIQTLQEYHEKVGPVMQSNGITMSFPPKLATFKKISLSNGIVLNALEGGRKEGDLNQKLLIFMHGYPESALLCYGRYLDHFIKQGYWVIAPDMRGFNASSKPVPEGVDLGSVNEGLPSNLSFESLKKYITDLNAIAYEYIDVKLAKDYQLLVTEYAKREKAIFISHDWGAAALTYTIREYPEIIEKAVLGVAIRVNGGKYLKEHTIPFLKQMVKSWYVFFLQAIGLSDYIFRKNDFAFFFNFGAFDEEARKGRLSAEEAKLWMENIRNSFTTGTSFYRGAFRAQSKRSFEQNKVDFPVLFMHAENDKYLTVEAMEFSLKEALTEKAQSQSKVLLVKDSSHWIQFYGEKFIKEVDDFIRRK